MSQTNISAALSTRLATVSGGYAIQYENQSFTPTANAPYLAESLNPTGTNVVALSAAGSEALQGFYQVLCYAPAGMTKGPAFSAADAVEAIFTRGLRLTYGGVEVTILRTDRAPGFRLGDRFVVPISVYYWAAA
jgi:hypothetical protein